MTKPGPPAATPEFSIVIAVYNDWDPLLHCLHSLSQQINPPSFEVIVVDDGSRSPIPIAIRARSDSFPLQIIQQSHGGIATARNRGIRSSRGSTLLFIDADCKAQPDCLATLAKAMSLRPRDHYFQLHLVGDRSRWVGRAEDLRLITLQQKQLQSDGRIRYLNTAGFAIRRSAIPKGADLFDPRASRAEDTLLLAVLMERGELPVFVENATAVHAIPLSFLRCVLKDIKTAYLELKAYELIADKGINIRVSHRERLEMIRAMWKASADPRIGRFAWLLLVMRQGAQRILSLVFQSVRPGIRH